MPIFSRYFGFSFFLCSLHCLFFSDWLLLLTKKVLKGNLKNTKGIYYTGAKTSINCEKTEGKCL